MPPRRRNMLEVEMEEMRRRLRELEATVEAQRTLLETRSEQREDDSGSNSSSSSDYHRPRRQQSFHSNDIKVDIPEFEGRLQPDEFIDWLQTVERVFEYKEIPEEQKVKIVALKLKKHASIWWENLKRKRTREGKGKITTWEKMRRQLTSKFLPEHYHQENFIRLQSIRQNALTVEEYSREFEQLMMKCDIQEKEELTIARYLTGLNPDISRTVQLQQYWTLDDVIRLAIRVEKQTSKMPSFQPSSSRSYSDNHKTQFQQFSSPNKPPPRNPKEFNSKTTKCFKCQGFGHIASDCPNRRVVTIIEGETSAVPEEKEKHMPDKEPVFDEEPIFDEEVIPPDQGEMLVIRRLLHTDVVKEEPWLRRNIFHTRCTSQGKVCNVIIDSGSCENVVSNYMVDKLQLQTHCHPCPYKLQWLNEEDEVEVSKRCLVDFSIGKGYHDKVWCDVVPMDACHLLLGRPWQYDRRTLYDGRTNTYSFQKDGRKIQLAPLPPDKSKPLVSLVQKSQVKQRSRTKATEKLPEAYRVSTTLNAAELSPYNDDANFDSRSSFVQPREDEAETYDPQ